MDNLDVPDSWHELANVLVRDPGAVLFLGEPDAGKSTCAFFLAQELAARSLSVAFVDGDIGQAHLGPPATQGLALVNSQVLQLQHLYFVGAITPAGHLLQAAGGIKKLTDRARELKAEIILVNTTGFISGQAATALKLHKVELLSPRHIVALERGDELAGILTALASPPGITIHRLAVSRRVLPRTPEQRRAYRRQRYQDYFSNSGRLEIPLQGIIGIEYAGNAPHLARNPQALLNLMVGLNDPEDFSPGVGIIRELVEDSTILSIETPLRDLSAVARCRIGTVAVGPDWEDHPLVS